MPVRLGATTDDGLPTLSRAATGTLSAVTTPGARAVVPGPKAEAVLPEPSWEAAWAGAVEPPVTLMITIVPMTTRTSTTGTSADITGCFERNPFGHGCGPLGRPGADAVTSGACRPWLGGSNGCCVGAPTGHADWLT